MLLENFKLHKAILFQLKLNSPVIFDDLWSAMESDVYDSNLFNRKTRKEISETMHSWTDVSGYPILMVERNYHSGIAKISIDRKRSGRARWCIPLIITTENTQDYPITAQKILWLTPKETKITVKGIDNWYLVTLQQAGKLVIINYNSYRFTITEFNVILSY